MTTRTMTMITIVQITPTMTRDAVGRKHKLMYSTHSQSCYTYMVAKELWWE